jgi:Family of unknown function (DUF6920)
MVRVPTSRGRQRGALTSSPFVASVLCGNAVSWTASELYHAHARFTAHCETAEIDYTIDENGRLKAVNMPRWGNPGGGEFRYANCGGFVDQEHTFGVTRYQPVCELVGISELRRSSQKASSSEL